MNEQEGDFGVRTLLLSWTRSRIIMWDFSLPVFCEVHHAPIPWPLSLMSSSKKERKSFGPFCFPVEVLTALQTLQVVRTKSMTAAVKVRKLRVSPISISGAREDMRKGRGGFEGILLIKVLLH